MKDITFLFIEENIGWDSFYWFFIMKITLHNKTFEWRLRLVEWRYAQARLAGDSPGTIVNQRSRMVDAG